MHQNADATCAGVNTHHSVRLDYTSSTVDAGFGKISHQRDIYTSENGNPLVGIPVLSKSCDKTPDFLPSSTRSMPLHPICFNQVLLKLLSAKSS